MDILQRLGGRKFLFALVLVGVGAIIELKTDRGLTATYAGLLGTLYATFSAANYGVSKAHMTTKGGQGQSASIEEAIEKIDELSQLARSASDQEAVAKLVDLLTNIQSGLADVKNTTAQVGQAVIAVSQQINRRGQ